MPRDPYDPKAAEQLLQYVRLGAYAHIAAPAAGVPRPLFERWVARGEKPRAREPYRSFVRQLRTMEALARAKAETAALTKDPKFWLTHGPGRETAETQGWTGEPRPVPMMGEALVPGTPAWEELCRTMLGALEPYPEARWALGRVLAQVGQQSE
jgi:hypothetical protein